MTINNINITNSLKNVEKMLLEDKAITPQVRAMFELLVLVINLLLAKLGVNSTNSSVPPSRDINRKRGSRRKVAGEKRKPGGQPGHEGTNLQREESPDKIEELKIDKSTLPKGTYTQAGFEARQVIDIVISKHVTEYQAEILKDSEGREFIAVFPAGITRPVQYGVSVKAQAVYMSQQQLIPYDRIRDYFKDQCGISLSAGSVFNFNKQAFGLLETFESIVKKQLIIQALLHADETGINIGGKLTWLHSLSNDLWTLFFPHTKRGSEAMLAMGILEHFHGILCHDHWKAYFNFKCLHALCNAHHLRELERAFEQDNQKWAEKMKLLLLEINEATKAVAGCLGEKQAEQFIDCYRLILAEGDLESPAPENKNDNKPKRIAKTKSRNLLERLRNFETETLRFMTNAVVPFTNNQSENDIRMTKVQQKISGCFRSFEGAQYFCRIRSYISTCSKHGIPPTNALNSLFSGKLPEFLTLLI